MFRTLPLLAALLGATPALAQAASGHVASAPADTARPFTVERVGRGRPMILIPGLASSGEVWRGTVAHFRDRYQLHVLTLAGFGGAPPLPGDRYLEAERDAVIRYIREQKLDHPVLVGHSLGGFLALWIAASAPELVGPVVSVDGVPYLPVLGDSTTTPERMRPQAEQVRALYASLAPDQMAMQSAMALRAMMKDSANREMGVRWSRASDPATVGRAVSEMLTTDLRGQVAAIRSPLLLVASGDGQAPEERGRTLAAYEAQVARVPRHRVVMAENARHFVMLDDPAFLFSTMDAFLATP